MRAILLIMLIQVSITQSLWPQGDYEKSILKFQQELNEEYKNPIESPLSIKEWKVFEEHAYFPIDEKYHILASFEKLTIAPLFKMKTSANIIQDYDVYGVATFTFEGNEYQLNIYQSHQLITQDKYKDDLFLPFTDQTNGSETYGGGRYIDLKIPTGDSIELDFNKAYNPFCAYSSGYVCPIPPKEMT